MAGLTRPGMTMLMNAQGRPLGRPFLFVRSPSKIAALILSAAREAAIMPDWYRLKWYGVLAIGAGFSAGGIAMIVSGERRGWVVFLFFLFCAAMAVHELWPQIIERHKPESPDTVLKRYRGPVVLRVPQLKQIFFLLSGLVFGGCLAYVALYGDLGVVENAFLWLGVTLVVAATPFMLLAILRGSTLRIDADGLQIFQGLKRTRLSWRDVSEFSVADAGVLSPAQHLMVVFDEASTRNGTVAAFNRSLLGKSGGLPDSYGMEPWHLAWLLNEWRMRALASPPRPPQSHPAP
jgi:hypothetical protein